MSSSAAVVGSGPNGLAAAVTLARAGVSVTVYEAADTPGGGCRTADVTITGFHHDVCSAVHPLLAASPFFRGESLGIRLLQPDVAFAHPLDGGRAAAVVRSVAETAGGLGEADGRTYRRLFDPLVEGSGAIVPAMLAPLRSPPRHPVPVARFGALGLLPARVLVHRFDGAEAKAALGGAAAHALLPLNAPLSGAFGLFLTTLAHTAGWPVVEGGSGEVIGALVRELESFGGKVVTGRRISSLAEIDEDVVLLDVSPRMLVDIAGDRLSARERHALMRYRQAPGVFKVDWALDGPVPWAADACRRTTTVHLGGTFEEVARAEADVAAGRHPDRPFCIITQPSVVDGSRAPRGKHALWGYCHVPRGSPVDMTDRIERQIERFAPGFRDLILHKTTRAPADLERENANYVGGDITGGAVTLMQTLFRPTVRWNPYRTSAKGVYLCSASTPPGAGVHGMCGMLAARAALADLRG